MGRQRRMEKNNKTLGAKRYANIIILYIKIKKTFICNLFFLVLRFFIFLFILENCRESNPWLLGRSDLGQWSRQTVEIIESNLHNLGILGTSSEASWSAASSTPSALPRSNISAEYKKMTVYIVFNSWPALVCFSSGWLLKFGEDATS